MVGLCAAVTKIITHTHRPSPNFLDYDDDHDDDDDNDGDDSAEAHDQDLGTNNHKRTHLKEETETKFRLCKEYEDTIYT